MKGQIMNNYRRMLGSGVAALAVTCAGVLAADAETVLPVFSAANFEPGAAVDNPYYPLIPGRVATYAGLAYDDEEDEFVAESFVERVQFGRVNVAGVDAVEVYVLAYAEGVLVEETRDWYAQDRDGNVWYLGEDTNDFFYDDDGNLIGKEPIGAWRTGVNGALPGYQMPADPTVGMNYYQEFAPNDEAEDEGLVVALSQTLTGPLGTYENLLWTEDFTAVEPGVLENKYYAPGVGLIREEGDFDGNGVPQTVIELTSVSTIPTPTAAACGLAGIGLLLSRRRNAQTAHARWG